MGIDPGLRFTGWGVIEAEGNRLRHVADGVLATDNSHAVPARLKFLHDELTALFLLYRPQEAAVEETYVNRNGAATLKLGLCARRGIAGACAGGDLGCGIRRDGGQARRRGYRCCHQGPGRDDGAAAAPGGDAQASGRGGRLGGRHLPRPPSPDPDADRGRHGDGVIALLTGRVEGIEADRCIVEVGGVGYLVQASTRTLAALALPPATARVLIETQVREDAITLYGFSESAERDWFRLLLTVQGVGAKVALNILSALSPSDLIGAIAAGDRASLTRAPGVGPKLAIRLLSELRDKAGAMPTGVVLPAGSAPRGPEADAISALANLGYRRAEAQPVVAAVIAAAGDGAGLDVILRESLRELAQK